MALSQNSKILVSDINTALSGKIDTAGTGLSKSGTTLALASVVTAGNAGPSANATLAYSGTFTVPYITYDAYGRVTGNANRTMTMPAASSSSITTCRYTRAHDNATTGSNSGFSSIRYVDMSAYDGVYCKLPSGGTWFCWHDRYFYILSGGSEVSGGSATAVGAMKIA